MDTDVIVTTPEELEEYCKAFATKEYRLPFSQWQRIHLQNEKRKSQEAKCSELLEKMAELLDEAEKWGLVFETSGEGNYGTSSHDVDRFDFYIK